MNWGKSFLTVILLLFLMPACGDAEWRFVSPMPHGRYGHGATLGPDGKIYVMGGMVFEVTEKRMLYKRYYGARYSNLVYDPQKDTWKYLEPVPGLIMCKRFYFFEPETDQWRYVRRVEGEKNYFEIDEGMTGWRRYPREIAPEELRATSFERQGDGVALVTGKDGIIYWIGGKRRSAGFGEEIVLPYHPMNSRWPGAKPKRIYYHGPTAYRTRTIHETDMPSMIDRRIDHEAVVTCDGKIYVMGGYQRDRHVDEYGNVTGRTRYDVLDTVECYDPETNKWEYKRPLPVKRMLFAAVVGPDDMIYVFGGALSAEPSTPVLNTTEVYDPKADTWSSRTPMPAPRRAHAGVLGANGKIYIMGGAGSGVDAPPLNDVFIYDPVKDTWKKGPPMKRRRDTLVAVATPDGKIYAIGGTDVGAYENSEKINFFLSDKHGLYTGKVQDTVEVLDIKW